MSCDVSRPASEAQDPHGALTQAAWREREAGLEERMRQMAEAWLSSQDRMCESDECWRSELRMEELESQVWRRRADDLQMQLESQNEEARRLEGLLFQKTEEQPWQPMSTGADTLKRGLEIEAQAFSRAEEQCSLVRDEAREASEQLARQQAREGEWLEERRLLLEQRFSDKEAMCRLRDEAESLRGKLEAQQRDLSDIPDMGQRLGELQRQQGNHQQIINAIQVEKAKLISEIQEQRTEMAQLKNENHELRKQSDSSLEATGNTACSSAKPTYLLNIDAMLPLSPRPAEAAAAPAAAPAAPGTFRPAGPHEASTPTTGIGIQRPVVHAFHAGPQDTGGYTRLQQETGLPWAQSWSGQRLRPATDGDLRGPSDFVYENSMTDLNSPRQLPAPRQLPGVGLNR